MGISGAAYVYRYPEKCWFTFTIGTDTLSLNTYYKLKLIIYSLEIQFEKISQKILY